MSDTEHYPVIWVDSSSESEDSAMYATCADDTIDLQLSDNDEICHLINALAIEEEEAADRAGILRICLMAAALQTDCRP